MQRAFVESGKARSSLKDPEFQNCEFPQLLVSDEYITPEIRLKNLLDFFFPATLHIEIGAFDSIWKKMKVVWPESEKWPGLVNIVAKKHFGIEGNFSGKQARALLSPSKFAMLLRIAAAPESRNASSPLFIRALMALKNIIDSIFGNTLKEDWRDILKEFKDCILDLETQHGLNYKFKYHFLFEHIPYYVEKYGALGKYNEQTIEVRWRFINQFF